MPEHALFQRQELPTAWWKPACDRFTELHGVLLREQAVGHEQSAARWSWHRVTDREGIDGIPCRN
jgi:hypothetical protein